jgi:hypothetical protein
LGNIKYTGIKYRLNTELVYFGILKKSFEEKKGDNIEKYDENKLQLNKK